MARKQARGAPKGQDLNANDYLAAAREHIGALPLTYDGGDYVLTIYVSGLAVECLFRAFREKKGLPFGSDHKLADLAADAGFPDLVPMSARTAYDAALADVIVRWRNSHRFRSLSAMRRFLKSLKLDRGIRGDFVKESARQISSSAIILVGLGVQRWRR